VLSFRSDQWATDLLPDAYVHWTFFVGPAEDVRQGGSLLWDVPSWYGFLDILLLASLPTDSCWQSMYLMNSSSLFISAVVVYSVLRALRRADELGAFLRRHDCLGIPRRRALGCPPRTHELA
jgi:hypothetical protein